MRRAFERERERGGRGAGFGLLGIAAMLSLFVSSPVIAAGPPVFIDVAAGASAPTSKRVRDVVAERRSIRSEVLPPEPSSVSPERAAMDQRAAAIKLALERALRLESEAAWSDCVREAAGVLGDAVLVLAKVGNLARLRDLHVQIGACLMLSERASDARPHFIAAALLDESPPQLGMHREEAEKAQAEARAEVLARAREPMKIETDPPGAEAWIDGRKLDGLTPLSADVRVGDHYLTLRRFRYEPHTERAVLQPQGALRVALDPARRDTLREQLAAIGAHAALMPSDHEALLAKAAWARAEQLVAIGPGDRGSVRVRLIDAATGSLVRSADVRATDDEDALRKGVCGALGETCEVKHAGIPWYAWVTGGAALVGGAVIAGLVADANREYRFCPSAGCR